MSQKPEVRIENSFGSDNRGEDADCPMYVPWGDRAFTVAKVLYGAFKEPLKQTNMYELKPMTQQQAESFISKMVDPLDWKVIPYPRRDMQPLAYPADPKPVILHTCRRIQELTSLEPQHPEMQPAVGTLFHGLVNRLAYLSGYPSKYLLLNKALPSRQIPWERHSFHFKAFALDLVGGDEATLDLLFGHMPSKTLPSVKQVARKLLEAGGC